ncbi:MULTISPECIES: transglycosylase domain-containing protein [Streptomyces]|uniref:Transglycosylase domain-containing protein n=1 Tax=Streptomyces mirabilis TaxID=68239 RepID=A0ABU3UNW2_9ACTN|nr:MULTISPECIES: transglycosylase domain-containing protein [Streptomyces]MCX4610667.1 penicillin-binding protein [Streptomyces mirabilis]MDU8995620.1 transglycosylase domain-containing protein [Streptomyces mirabilis]NMI59890.1 penicillin-binding protein [Streptomyces sp. RLA2-12]QDN59107.1 penicillin-binding protein [Streptomyces sp. S1D4-20]QDN69182.1 penicillin-binding protein [Streptomyces sp. S1D4-14]
MPKKRSGGGLSPTQQAAKFLGVSVLAGAVMAGIALPAAGALGLAAKGSVQGFDEIPDNLKSPALSQRTTILDSKGGQIATVYSRDRTVVDLKDISPYMQKAIVAIEDSRFYQHGAIDLKGVLRALNQNAQNGGVAQGASTLTQQLVKNYFVEEAGDDPTKVAQATQQTLGRKVRELKYAIQLEEKLGKKKILENYLNITFFGEQAYGIEAAAQRYFSKPAKDLNLQESALLAGIVQSPSRYDPVNDEAEATKRRNTVLQRMAEVHDISQQEADQAKEAKLGLKVSQPKNGCITAVKGASFFCKYVENVFLTDPVFGKTKEARAKLWNQGGLTIRTTLDPQAQKSVQSSIKSHVNKSDSVATAATLVEPGTGKIVGMGQSRPYGYGKNETEYNYSVDRDMGGSNYGFPTGSTFKPFVAAAALEEGRPATQQYPSPYEMAYPSPVQTCSSKPWTNLTNEKLSNESTEEKGPYALKTAMAKSVNTYFVQMISDIGICPVVKMTDKLHVVQGNGDKLPEVPAITLGSKGISPLTMASAYATFASRGMYCTPIAIESITQKADGREKSLEVPKSTCSRAMSEKTADTVNTLLQGVIDSGTGQQAGLSDRDNAGKTGTTDERKNAWFVGYTPNLSGAVWVGSPKQNVKMTGIRIGGVYHDLVYGGQVPGPIWKDAMTGALVGKDSPSFNLVDIPDEKPKDNGHGPTDGNNGANANGGNTTNGNTVNGNTISGNTISGATGATGNTNGGGFPTPTFSLPSGFIQGQNGNGGRHG